MADGARPTNERAATIVDVAREAGVSFKTVSRVLNGETNVREGTRDKVLQAVQALDYRPNHNARNLRARKSAIIAIFFSNPSRNYLSELLWGALKRCQSEGYSLISEECTDGERAILALRSDTQVAGVIVAPRLSDNADLLKALDDRQMPYVRIAPGMAKSGCSDVSINDHAAANDMTQHLIGLGHNRIAFIKGPDTHVQGKRRLEGYLAALKQNNLVADPDLIADGQFTFDSGIRAAEMLLEAGVRPTAIFAGNDDMAAGVLAAAYRRRISVPDDLSVVGFDDTPLASTISPALTTIAQPSADLAGEAVSLLLEAINGGAEPQHRVLDYKLVKRESAAAPKR